MATAVAASRVTQAGAHQIGQAALERQHPLLAARLQHRRQLRGLALADEAGDACVAAQHLHAPAAARRRARAARGAARPPRAARRRAARGSAAAARRVGVDDALDRRGGAVRLCRLASTRWPVSAAVSAREMVSGSRISPMSRMSGSSRSASRSPVGKSLTSRPIWRCRTSPPAPRRDDVLDRILERDEERRAPPHRLGGERRERRALARAGRAARR